MTKLSALLLFTAIAGTNAFSTQPPSLTVGYTARASTQLSVADTNNEDDITPSMRERRNFLVTATAATAAAILAPVPAYASGGATAGKYTTIPIAKRRYYGRVQEAVHEFLLMAPAVIAGDLNDPLIQDFFDVTKTVVVPGKKKDINGICTKKDGDCKSTTIYDSRYNDMKTTMYLLGNAFRINQQKAPDNLPTVQASKKFFKEMDTFERKVLNKEKKKVKKAPAEIYADALDILDVYLDLVELPPTDSGHYDKEFSTLVGETSRIT
mmetsp:Transcript_3424/g.5373  ORF Transcript_3424/g.5373 Transcript_3424/m.5373 type:complete len:267 (-) Transcript_3424:300-1100(-)